MKPLRRRPWLFAVLLLMGCLTVGRVVSAEEIRVAVAANFTAPMEEIAAGFKRATGRRITLIFGATGVLYAQIKSGAPFDVLLAADSETPSRLVREGNAVAESQFTYAIGKLVLWSPRPGFVDREGQVLRTGGFAHLSICNPKLAPYGAASVETMKALGIYEELKPKIVEGQNVTQAYQFVASGAAEIGFVAMSQVFKNGRINGSAWIVPSNLYSTIRQDAVILEMGKDKSGSAELMHYLRSDSVLEVIRSYGYER